MRRRTYLTSIATAGVTGTAGCLGDDDDADDTPDDEGTDTDDNGETDTEETDENGNGTDDSNHNDEEVHAPATTMDFYFDGDTLSIDITGGDSFESDRVSVTGENIAAEGNWYEFADDVEPGDVIAAGGSIQFGADADFLVELVWEAPDGAQTVIADGTGPDR